MAGGCETGRERSWEGEGPEERAAFVVLESSCLPCHERVKLPGMVDLRTRERAVATGALAEGSLESSRLAAVVGAMAEGEVVTMPPTGHALERHEVEVLQVWLARGAGWPAGGKGELKALAGAEPRSR
ncbi:MAG: hypothetical protein P8J87_07220 [Verrucomicrobiales bacterium]|nr:hypothetical protein [Verrucomicrobiales bacterium]